MGQPSLSVLVVSRTYGSCSIETDADDERAHTYPKNCHLGPRAEAGE